MKQARIVDSVAIDVVTGDPAEMFHPDIAAHFVVVPDNVEAGWKVDADGHWSAPDAPEPPAVVPPKVGPIAFTSLFTAFERVKADELKATDPFIKDFWALLDDPRTDYVDMALPSVQATIRHTLEQVKAAGVEVDVDARFAQILTGAPL